MKKQKIEEEFKKYKYKYLFLITISILGFISGIIFSNILSYSDFKDVSSVVKDYFLNLKDNVDINYLSNFINSISVNSLYLVLLFIFGLSIIGIILNPFILYFKSMVLGFSVGIIISIYGFRGIPLAIFYLFPNQILNIIIYILMSFYGINLSIKLFKSLFLRKSTNYQDFMKKYLIVLGLSFGVLLISSLYETFIADFIMKLFTFLIK